MLRYSFGAALPRHGYGIWLALCAWPLLAAATCAGERSTRPTATQSSQELRSQPARRLPLFEVIAPYSATLIHALEYAAPGAPEHARIAGLPGMLAEFQLRSSRWVRSPYHQHIDATFVPHRACAYGDVSLQSLQSCLARVLPAEDAAFARQAVLAYHSFSAKRWQSWSSYLGPTARELARIVQGREGALLSKRLFDALATPDRKLPRFKIVLARQPPGSRLLGTREERTLILAIHGDRGTASLAETAFHELAHFALQYSNRVQSLEEEFQNFGDVGAIAANHWNEAFATAFGQGLAAARLNPRFCFERSMYGNETVDAIAHALYLLWRKDPLLEIGASFARRLVGVVRKAWPAERWRRLDFVVRAEVVASSARVLDAFQSEMQTQRFWGSAPIASTYTRDASAPPMVARLVVATPQDLARARWALAGLGITLRDVDLALRPTGRAQLWRSQRNGAKFVLIVGRDEPRLMQAVTRFWDEAELAPLDGWARL